ncbi:MAG TPA: hypothetical protein PL033_10560 [Candidatus Brocadiia bacterium]|nr:hypothetical protein [Candidatus Brocadiia bacterium]
MRLEGETETIQRNKHAATNAGAVEILDVEQTSRHSGLTPRAFIIGAMAVIFIVLWTPYNNYILFSTLFVGNHLPIGIICMMMLLVFVNGIVKAVAEGSHLSTSELIIIWSMMTVSAGLPGAGLLRYWPSTLTMPWWLYADGGHAHWKPIMESLDPRLFPTTEAIDAATGLGNPVIENFRAVESNSPVPWGAWLGPIAHWSVLFLGLFGLHICLSFLLRQQWVHNEHVSFPIIQMSIEMVREPEKGRAFNSLLRSRKMWVAASVPIVIQLMAGLNTYYPTVPAPKLTWALGGMFTEHPWKMAYGSLYNGKLYLSVAAVAMLVPSDVAFSVWFFYLVLQAERIFLGWVNVPTWTERRSAMDLGASVIFALTLFWGARTYLRRAFATGGRIILRSRTDPQWRPAGIAAIGVMLTGVITWLWLWRYGMGPVWAMCFLGGVVVMILLVARAVNEAGVVHVETGWTTLTPMLGLFGLPAIGLKAASLAAIFTVPLGHDMGETLLPHAMHSQRMSASSGRLKLRHLALAMFLALVIGLAVGIPGHLIETYHFGMFREDGWGTVSANNVYIGEVATAVIRPIPRGKYWLHFSSGGAIALFLAFMRRRYAGWPFHALGFILADGYPVGALWLSIMLGWMVKTMVLRYGGAKTYQRLKPAIYGVIIGDYAMGGVWMLVNAILYWTGRQPVGIFLLPT